MAIKLKQGKASNGAYQSQDGTYWQFVPKKVVENK